MMNSWHRQGIRKALLAGQLAVLAWFAANTACAQQEATEYELKAAFLYNFAAYVTWPDGMLSSPDSPIVFGVLGAQELAENLEAMSRERQINGHRIEVRDVRSGDSLRDIHVLFVGHNRSGRGDEALELALQNSILTVTESEFARPVDSIINLEVSGGRVRFDVSITAANEARLSISARLLQIAERVIGQTP